MSAISKQFFAIVSKDKHEDRTRKSLQIAKEALQELADYRYEGERACFESVIDDVREMAGNTLDKIVGEK